MNILDLFIKRNKYRMIEIKNLNDEPVFVVEVRGLLRWHIVKTFENDDAEYAKNCAQELLDMLNEEIL